MILTIDLLTEQGPAISLAYERSEAAVMTRPPRNLVTDRLVSAPSLVYSYIIAGTSNSLICMFAYFLVYTRRGIPLSKLAFSLDKGYFANPPFVNTTFFDSNTNTSTWAWTSGVRPRSGRAFSWPNI